MILAQGALTEQHRWPYRHGVNRFRIDVRSNASWLQLSGNFNWPAIQRQNCAIARFCKDEGNVTLTLIRETKRERRDGAIDGRWRFRKVSRYCNQLPTSPQWCIFLRKKENIVPAHRTLTAHSVSY